MKILLAIDIGNTNITAGIFAGRKLMKKARISTHAYHLYAGSFRRLFKSAGSNMEDVRNAIISSVVPVASKRVLALLKKILKCEIALTGKNVKVPIKNLYRVKSEVGQDRLVNAYAANVIYGSPAVIIDFGTAITFDLVSGKGEYLGGLIMPGIEMSLRSLHRNTALLPMVELKKAPHLIGRDTVNSMRGGILFGFGAMCDGLVAQYKKILGRDTRVILTGGNAKLVRKYAKYVQIVDEDITLKGLRLINESCGKKIRVRKETR